jgi:DNA primase
MLEIYHQVIPNLKKAFENEWKGSCPYPDHQDDTPSFFVNEKTGQFWCGGCGRSGNAYTFSEHFLKLSKDSVPRPIQEQTNQTINFVQHISEKLVEQLHHNLLSDHKKLEYILRVRLLSFFIVKKFLVGYDTESNRFTFPIKSFSGKFVNIKLHNSDLIPKSLSWNIGYGKARLFPISALHRTSIVICEGEFDCLLLHSLGINAITSTAGAGSWDKGWSRFFQLKEVRIIFDSDIAGTNASNDIGNQLTKCCKSVKQYNFSSGQNRKEDVTSFIQNGGNIFKLLQIEKRK